MKKTFKLNFENCTFTLLKENVEFFYGYGIAYAFIDEKRVLIGVVDEDFKEVLPLNLAELVPKLFIAPNGNFIFLTYNAESDKYQVMHLNRESYVVNLDAYDFTVIDDEVIELHYENYAIFYDTQTGEFLTPCYNYISPFVDSEKYGTRVARVAYYVTNEEGIIINELSSIVNTKGQVLENYRSLATGEEIQSKDLPDVLMLMREK